MIVNFWQNDESSSVHVYLFISLISPPHFMCWVFFKSQLSLMLKCWCSSLNVLTFWKIKLSSINLLCTHAVWGIFLGPDSFCGIRRNYQHTRLMNPKKQFPIFFIRFISLCHVNIHEKSRFFLYLMYPTKMRMRNVFMRMIMNGQKLR